ncbi:aspartate/glutamate racemase family protein [Vibrio campbellii]|jgi:allantoin racemase|uniref:Hydantoin racemase n=1 Tax=Vibrio campbellii TaxID=680 RepID=A0AAE9N5P4_9VIBR|nr:aspartate/glutamate racemase family protein [Vibrio campbellii]ARV75656.1 hypothetical protein A8140_23650 [Vibrio campbellii CAIM 519 = NBRC 15631 = ATCC 25920]ELU51287.1 Asp/Glu racemase [Vibrio campbellii CAIM 519 = NBRC 15631 = ATCC 25920]RDX37912.1 hypothetical protein DZA51_01935 [Vibrio campbellii]UTZ25244.1 hypothetical protein HB760_26165 [Vibrio campbellii]UTZ29854.1 hypothetical protein HB761_24660 [Vibrio campbellii]|tara:strand:- start:72 stop:860 length:789 start_codon:yes stop_codon:yes gene_type:complete
MKKVKIRVITAFPVDSKAPTRVLADLKKYESDGIEISLSSNKAGAAYFNSDTEQFLSMGALVFEAIAAEKEGCDAIVIESGADTGLEACREVVSIPVVGLADIAFRTASMLGRKFGLMALQDWHGYAIERMIKKYQLTDQYCGHFTTVGSTPFWVGEEKKDNHRLETAMKGIRSLIDEYNADTIVMGGSYFCDMNDDIKAKLLEEGYGDIVLINQLPLAINFAETLVKSKLCHSKKIYAIPRTSTAVFGYKDITVTPSLENM